MKHFLLMVAVFVITSGCSKSAPEPNNKLEFVGKWVSVRDFRSSIDISKNGDSYIVFAITPDIYLGGPPIRAKMPATMENDMLRVESLFRSALVVDKRTGRLVTPDGDYRRLTDVPEDKNLRGCWKAYLTKKYFIDRVEQDDNVKGVLYYDGRYSTSYAVNKSVSQLVVSSYQFLRPGTIELAVEKNDSGAASIGMVRTIDYHIRNGELHIESIPVDAKDVGGNTKKMVKFESVSKYLSGLSKEECTKVL